MRDVIEKQKQYIFNIINMSMLEKIVYDDLKHYL